MKPELKIHVYHISRGWVRCEVITGSALTKKRIGTSVITPDKGLTSQQRRWIIEKWLAERFKINPTNGVRP
jgi:hypothetical protein